MEASQGITPLKELAKGTKAIIMAPVATITLFLRYPKKFGTGKDVSVMF